MICPFVLPSLPAFSLLFSSLLFLSLLLLLLSCSEPMAKTTVKHGVLSAGNLSMDQFTVLLASSKVVPPCVADGSALKTRDGNATCS